MNIQDRSELLKSVLPKKILVLDGAMGTSIQNLNLTADDFGGVDLEGCNENLVLTRPHLIQKIHEEFLEAGADIIETNTFGGTPLVLGEFDIADQAIVINRRAAEIAREAADKYTTPEKPRFVAGSMGPTTKSLSVTGGVTFAELTENFGIQAKALIDGGVDYLLLETCQDARNIKAALIGIDLAFEEAGKKLPIAVTGTIETMGTTLGGQAIDALYASLAHRDLLYIGLNCATGPEFMTDHIRTLSQLSHFPTAAVPNAGLPDEDGNYLETPEMMSKILARFLEKKWVNFLGGCCGTTPAHIKAIAELAKTGTPRKPNREPKAFVSGIDYLEITDELRPVIVGERTNVIGSRKFKRLITEQKFEEAAEIGRAQIKNGAQIVDVCLSNPDRDEIEDTKAFMDILVKKIKAPIMIDSTDDKVIELGLTYCQGKALINSINLEDGEERFQKIVPLAKKYGAALVVGTIDDDPNQGMGVSKERKLEIAERSYELLTKKYGVLPEDIYWDPLVFPCGTGDAQYVGSAKETIEGIRLIKQKYPRTKSVLGISNVSFGLPPAGREVLNSVFLYHCVQSGLDLAIVNSEKLERYSSIPEEDRVLANNLIFNLGDDPVGKFSAHFRDQKVAVKKDKSKLPLEERLPQYILEGSKDGLTEDLDEALKTMVPLDVINGPLMKGMDEVGRLFNQNKLIVAEVLQSAEAMKAAVSHLEQFMEKKDTSKRGKVVLATVKGDVHDIGKNLVEIIFSNNGFEIINLGIKVPPEKLIEATREHKPDIVGLSGLLVKSAQQMVITAEDFTKADIDVPVLVGGAALTENFVDKKISKAYRGTAIYAKDAMKGLELAKVIVDPKQFAQLKAALQEKRAKFDTQTSDKAGPKVKASTKRSSRIQILDELPSPPDFKRHILRSTPIDHIWKYVNPLMLYTRHLGLKGGVVKLLSQYASERSKDLRSQIQKENEKALTIWETVEEVKREFRDVFTSAAVYRFYEATSDGNKINIHLDSGKDAFFEFPRQAKEEGLCLADYLSPQKEKKDSIALFATTVGTGVRAVAEKLKNEGNYLKSHIVQALAIESAEAYAELLHTELRKAWGFLDPEEMTMLQRFQAKYRGKRYSFGYPACPRLDDQALLFDLLKPSDIGIELTDGFMMDPEASVTAVVFHHPEATYFSVGSTDEENR